MKSKQKILVFIDWYLPGYRGGGPIQSCANLIAHLNDSYDFYVVTRDTDYCETQPYQGIKSNEWNTLANGTKIFYISNDNLKGSTIQKIIQETEFDVGYVNGVYSLYFSFLPLFYLRRNGAKKIVLASRGMLAESAINVKKVKKKIYLALIKILGLFANITFHATTEAEIMDIKNVAGTSSKILVAPNLPKKENQKEWFQKQKNVGSLRLINIARIAPEKNLKYALEILERVKTEIEFDFYGPVYDQDYYQECAALIKKLPNNIHVNYKNSIPSELVNATFQNYHAMFMPTRGENFGHIILESLTVGCPVIISNQTPWKNLQEKKVGYDLSLSQPEKFVQAIEKFAAMSQSEFDDWSKAAMNFGNDFINNPEILKQNLLLFSNN